MMNANGNNVMKYMLVIILFVGCASAVVKIGTDFDASRISLVEKGKTDKQTINSLFGIPYQKSVNENKERWHYIYLVTKSDAVSFASMAAIESDTRTKKLDILFDSSGIVNSYDYTIPGDVDLTPAKYTPIVEERSFYPIESRKLVRITVTSGETYEVFVAGESASKYYVSKQRSDTSYVPIQKAIIKRIEDNFK